MKNILNVCSNKAAVLSLVALLTGCSISTAPVRIDVIDLRAPGVVVESTHTVKKRETLYSIAWIYSLDHRELAAVNKIEAPYRIFPGQVLSLKQQAETKKVENNRTIPADVGRRAVEMIEIEKESAGDYSAVVTVHPANDSPKSFDNDGEINWTWPAEGAVTQRYDLSGRLNKGIDIQGDLGEPVVAAAAGEVVYANSDISAYGRLIILKHNNSYLSAYAHNRKLLVREGDSVKAGQEIAEIGSSGTTEPRLHFEIRQDGVPVDPMQFLPKR